MIHPHDFPERRSLAPMPLFPEFYHAVNRRCPFPWQERLADEVAATGQWPDEIGVPTGLGKTACLDIALWWLASQAGLTPQDRIAPTRIWWVVNRRLLVDSTAAHAEALAITLAGSLAHGLSARAAEVVAIVADRLRSLSADPAARPLEVIRLRGGLAPGVPTDPSSPAVILCTLPMYGSRLLFRGYGSRLRTVDAAMAGTDSLVLLDEAHLTPHLKTLLPALAKCTPHAQDILGEARSRAKLVALTATGDADERSRFVLNEGDYAHSIIQQRLDAVKPLKLLEKTGNRAQQFTTAAHDLIGQAPHPMSCLVFANTPKMAREVFERLRKKYRKGAEVLLLTGRVREREAERIRARILDPVNGMAAARTPGVGRQHHLIVVATQTLEVGADIDAEYLITEACGVRALTQRLGRLNRLGDHTHASAVCVYLLPPKSENGSKIETLPPDPVYGEEPARVCEKLKTALDREGTHTVNLSPRRVAEVLGPPCDDPGRAPEVLPEILWEWTKTTIPPEGKAPVEPYFSGVAGTRYSVSLLWRIYVPDNGKRLWPQATDQEAVDVPIAEVRDALSDDKDLCRLAADGVTVETISSAADLRSGDQIVLRADRGLLDAFGWNPAATDQVVDVSLLERGLPLDAKAIDRLCGVSLGSIIQAALGIADNEEEIDPGLRDEAVKEILDAVRSAPVPAGWNQAEWTGFTEALTPVVVKASKEVSRLRVKKIASDPPSDDFDEKSLLDGGTASVAAARLYPHCEAVGARAHVVAKRIGLPDDLINTAERAGTLHDIGKADRRFQRWLDPGGERVGPLAKSNAPRHRWETMRAEAGWPRGGRHEDLSARLVCAWLKKNPAWGDHRLRDLLIHLVISHHGKGRPLVLPVLDGTVGTVSAMAAGMPVEAPADLAIVDWDQPSRFRRLSEHFGPWGLALIEAIVIRADHAVSADVNVPVETSS